MLPYISVGEGEKMNLKKSCEKGSISVAEFVKLLKEKKPLRVSQIGGKEALGRGDYVVLPKWDREDILLLERIVQLDSEGDFTTATGAIGPINGNIFVAKLQGSARYLLIEGDKVPENCSVYELAKKYLTEIEMGIGTLKAAYGWNVPYEEARYGW